MQETAAAEKTAHSSMERVFAVNLPISGSSEVRNYIVLAEGFPVEGEGWRLGLVRELETADAEAGQGAVVEGDLRAMSMEELPFDSGTRTEASAVFPENLEAPNETSLKALSTDVMRRAGLAEMPSSASSTLSTMASLALLSMVQRVFPSHQTSRPSHDLLR